MTSMLPTNDDAGVSSARRSPDEARLDAWTRRTGPIVLAAAIVPVAVGLARGRDAGPAVVLDLVSWSIFVADLLVHLRYRRGFLRTRAGVFDAAVVVLTAPWYLIPIFSGARFMSLGRLARLGRVFVVSRSSDRLRDLGRRVGHAALYSGVLLVMCALVVRAVEPDEAGFSSIGDSLWWAMVTFTTVGYGDLYPTTGTGRVAGAMLMIGGIALIGSLAASLGSFLGSSDDTSDAASGSSTTADGLDVQEQLLREVRSLRAEIAELRDQRNDEARPNPRPDTV